MANPLFYRNIVALNRETHKALRLREGPRGYGFARATHLIPALVEEFATAAPQLPIAFLPGPQRPSPVFVAGLVPGESLLVSAEGGWEGGYLPAYLRRYPFIIGEAPGATPVLCIDDSCEELSISEGTPLFTEAGEPGPRVEAALKLAQGYRAAAERSDAFCDLIQNLGLLRAVTLDAKRPGGQSTVVHGLLTIDEAALEALGEEPFLDLRRRKFLTAIYAHLFSLRALERLNERANAAEEKAA